MFKSCSIRHGTPASCRMRLSFSSASTWTTAQYTPRHRPTEKESDLHNRPRRPWIPAQGQEHSPTSRVRPLKMLSELGLLSQPHHRCKGDLTAIVIPNQADRPFLPVPQGNAALSIDVRLPEANTLERLLALGVEPAGQGNGQPHRNFCLVVHSLPAHGNLCVQVIQHPVDDNAGDRDIGPQRKCPTSDFFVMLEPSAPGPV